MDYLILDSKTWDFRLHFLNNRPQNYTGWRRQCCWRCLSMPTVWAEADSGVLCTGVRLLLRLSHRTIWPEYVPPTTRLGWNCANAADITADWTHRNADCMSHVSADNIADNMWISPDSGRHILVCFFYISCSIREPRRRAREEPPHYCCTMPIAAPDTDGVERVEGMNVMDISKTTIYIYIYCIYVCVYIYMSVCLYIRTN